jgi:transketolase
MRNAFAKKITELAKKNKKIILLSGDIGNKLFDDFKKNCKNQFYNCGVAENNMVGVAAGLSKLGFIPFVYTITPFLVSRSLEQIKLDICYPNLPVNIVGTGAGLSYARLGATHHSLDDISLMKSIPNMRVLCPGDSIEVEQLVSGVIKSKKPTYIRLGKKGEPTVNPINKLIKIDKINVIKEGGKILIVSIGNMLGVASEINQTLEKQRKLSTLISFHTFEEGSLKEFKNIINKFEIIIFLEEHFYEGSISNYLINTFGPELRNKKIIHTNIKKKFYCGLGEQDQARKKLEISASQIIKKI